MTLKVYNTLTRQKEDFVSLNPLEVKMYVCGITPYDETHLGHARAYVTFDVVRRYLEYLDYKVNHIQNITDIDDKIIKKSNENRVTSNEIAEKYTQAYFEVIDKLNVRRATKYPKATEHIPQMIEWIKGLIDKGFAYILEDGVYFEVLKFKDYGKLSGRKLDDMQAGARVGIDLKKRNPLDFVLWKLAKEGEPSWESPWGAGRPGWHIECSVMSREYLGEQFDIHGGGLDLEFPHHENEIAQTEALTGKIPWVKYWMHNGFLNINKEKMSKSLGNFFTLKDILAKYDPMVVRLFLLMTHYRSPINYSDSELNGTKAAYGSLVKAIEDIDFVVAKTQTSKSKHQNKSKIPISKFQEAMDDDFNTAGALAAIFELIKEINIKIAKKIIDIHYLLSVKETILGLCDILGLNIITAPIDLKPEEIEKLIIEREKARREKDFKKADQIRDKAKELGYIFEDTPQGTKAIKV